MAHEQLIAELTALRDKHTLDEVLELVMVGLGGKEKVRAEMEKYDEGEADEAEAPINYPEGTPGKGAVILQARDGLRVLVVNLMCRLYMDALGDPFAALDKVLKQNPMGRAAQAVIVDVHGEANSEKMAFGHFCDGRASLVIGTHTHAPTADYQIFPGGRLHDRRRHVRRL